MDVRAKVKVDNMAEKDKLKALEEHRRLASVIKNVHADLRKKLRASKCSKFIGFESYFKPDFDVKAL